MYKDIGMGIYSNSWEKNRSKQCGRKHVDMYPRTVLTFQENKKSKLQLIK